MLIPFPPDTNEQKRIGSMFTNLDGLVQAKRTKIAALQRLKKSLMQNLLTGRIRLSVNGTAQEAKP